MKKTLFAVSFILLAFQINVFAQCTGASATENFNSFPSGVAPTLDVDPHFEVSATSTFNAVSVNFGGGSGLGAAGGDNGLLDGTGESLTFTFTPSTGNTGLATDVSFSFEDVSDVGSSTPLTITANGSSGSLGSEAVTGAGPHDISALASFAGMPIQSFTITPGSNRAKIRITGLTYNMECVTPTAVPALSEWSTFLLAVTLLLLLLVSIHNLQLRTEQPNKKGLDIPFKMEDYLASLKVTLYIVPFGFLMVYLGWGEIIIDDFIGMALAIPLFAYGIFLFRWQPQGSQQIEKS